MSYSATASATHSWTTIDVQKVVRRFRADAAMIAQSTGAVTEEHAGKWADDVDLLAKEGYLRSVDLTLFSGAFEMRAVKYLVNTESGELQMSRPGGVDWPRVASARLRIILSYTDDYDLTARSSLAPRLKISWVSTNEDTRHAGLKQSSGRDYASNGWGLQRRDFG